VSIYGSRGDVAISITRSKQFSDYYDYDLLLLLLFLLLDDDYYATK